MTDLGNVTIGPGGRRLYTRHREQADRRPCVILSNDRFNTSRAELVVLVPVTSKIKGIPTHVRIEPPDGGLLVPSVAICEGVRSVARQFLIRRMGALGPDVLRDIELTLRDLLGF